MFKSLLKPAYLIILPALVIAGFGLATLYTFQGTNSFFTKQAIVLGIALGVCLLASIPDYRFMRTGHSVLWIYIAMCGMLALTYVLGFTALGAQMSFDLGAFSLQPVEFARIALILVLAKYFSMRHELIGSFRHIFVSGVYLGVPFVLTLLQPDFGSAIMLGIIWFGIVLISGIRMRHIAIVGSLATAGITYLWLFKFEPYQKLRIYNFLDPLADIQNTGYNAYQATIASGSGQMLGKGIGYGTQSKLNYLPESQTDFIFASFAEEWGFVGSMLLFVLFAAIVIFLIRAARSAPTNFERIFTIGFAIYIVAQFTTHIGMNIGVLPITGLPLPFMSFGGSHLVSEFLALGMIIGMTKHTRRVVELERSELI